MPTFALGSSVAVLAAVDVPLPVEMTALVMVGLILRVYIARENRLNERRDERLTELESARDEQRHLKHLVINQLTGVNGTLQTARQAALRCTCGAMVQVLPLIDNILNKEPDSR